MAGSLEYYVYTSDNGEKFRVKISKHLARGIAYTRAGGLALFDVDDRNVYPDIPPGLRMRNALCLYYSLSDLSNAGSSGSSRPQWRTFPIGNFNAYISLSSGFSSILVRRYPTDSLSTYWIPSRVNGESRPVSVRYDDPRL